MIRPTIHRSLFFLFILLCSLVLLRSPANAGGDFCNCCSGGDSVGCNNDSCEATVCASDDFCCDKGWDQKCDAEASFLCSCCPPAPVCGNGNIDSDTCPALNGGPPGVCEQCDDGNTVNGDGCSSTCQTEVLGACCVPATPGSECMVLKADVCTQANGTYIGDATLCGPLLCACGNGIKEPNEDCDDGNTNNDDSCRTDCTIPVPPTCGDGEINQKGEDCDPPGSITCPAGSPAGAFLACNKDCTCPAPPACGDGVVNTCPGLSAGSCIPEECDDGNTVSGDGCSSTCTNEPPTCGDGEINQKGEECDPPGSITCPAGSPAGAFLACNKDCTCPPTAACGDGNLDPGEQCDDGNTANGDGCSSGCKLEEICNDLVDNNGDGLVDCQDPVACDCDGIGQQRPHLVAASIFFDGPQDTLKINSNVQPPTPIDPVNEIVGFVLSNANGVVLSGQLPAGSLKKHGKSFLFRNAAARRLGGIGLVKIVTRKGGNFVLSINAYGDLSGATLPAMTLQLTIGNDSFVNTSNWTPSPHGFVLKIP